jgi:hypothetical protein
MPSKCISNGEYANSWLKLIFQGLPYQNMAVNDPASPITQFWISLHSDSPTSTGDQSTNEVSFDNYQRVSVNRDARSWNVIGNTVSPAITITFPLCSGGSARVKFFAIGTSESGSGHLFYFSEITPNFTVAAGSLVQLNGTITEQ